MPAGVLEHPISASPEARIDLGSDGSHPPIEPLFNSEDIRFGRYLRSDPPQRRWVLRDVLPLGIVGVLASMGGAGKSLFAYMLGLSVTSGFPFLGIEVGEPGGFLLLAGEDDDAEVHRRGLILLRHCQELANSTGVDFDTSAVADKLHTLSCVAADNRLTRSTGDREVHRTALVDRLIESASTISDLRMIVVDPVSRFRGGRANEEEDATRFVEALETVRIETGATVLALSHVSQAGITGGGGQEIVRGSTALVDGVRWVATLQPLQRDRAKKFGLQEDEASRHLRLEIPKSNYAPPFPGMWIRREAGGVLIPVELEELGAAERTRKSENTYLEILPRLQGLLASKGGLTRYALRRFSGSSGPLGAGDKTVRDVIERALRDGSVIEESGKICHPNGDLQ